MVQYLEIVICALLPALTALALFRLEQKGKFNKIPRNIRTIFLGIIFGLLAIAEGKLGLKFNGSYYQCRDASVLTAGLVFGGPVGLIAGFISAVERMLSATIKVSDYTGIAAILSTLFAGIFSALISRLVLEKKRPTCRMALFLTIAVEVFHMMTIFVTNAKNPANAVRILQNSSFSTIAINSVSVFLAVYLIAIAAGEHSFMKFRSRREIPVFQIIQKGMLKVITVCLILSCAFVNHLQSKILNVSTYEILSATIENTTTDLRQMVVNHMISESKLLWNEMQRKDGDPAKMAKTHYVSKWFVVDPSGMIQQSNMERTIGTDISKWPCTSEYGCLLAGESQHYKEYIMEGYNCISVGIVTEEGFFEAVWNGNGILKNMSGMLENYVSESCIGTSGSILITDSDGDSVISVSDRFPTEINDRDIDHIFQLKKISDYNKFIVTIGDKEYYCSAGTTNGFNVWALYPVEEVNLQRVIPVYMSIFLIIMGFTALYILLYMVIKKVVGEQIVKVADSLSLISSGKLDEVVNVRSTLEFNSLSDDINRTVDTMKNYIAEASARIDAELEAASAIQLSAMPNPEMAFPGRKEFEIYAKMDPAKEVGGDFYDFYLTGEDELNLMIADVSGKGIPAALFMMRAKSTLKDFTEKGSSVEQVFTEANNCLCSGNVTDMFVTAWQGKIHLDTGIMEFANAGHNAPLVRHGDGRFEYLYQKRNLVLAAMTGISYRKNQLQLQPGDTILLYTDGLVEATNAENKLYGEERLLKIINSGKFTSMREMVDIIRSDVDRFVGEAPQFDDLTMLAFQYKGKA